MVKKIVFLVVGFGLIAGGIAGISTALVDQKNREALKQIERIQEEARTAATEEQRKLEERRTEVERLASNVETQKLRLEGERQQIDSQRRLREAAAAKQMRSTHEDKSAHSKTQGRENKHDTGKKQNILSKKEHEPKKEARSHGESHRSLNTRAAQPTPQHRDAQWISRKAGLEAARLFAPVEYYMKQSRELVLAEPFDYGPDSVRVRVRIWRNERLVKDSLVRFSGHSLHEAGMPRA